MKLHQCMVLAAVGLSVAGCQGGTIYRKDTLGEINVLSVDARQRLVLQGNVGSDRVVCTEPSPDAISAQAVQLAASAAITNGGNQANAQLASGFSESVASIAMRTQTIQMLRDGYFRLCEARLNNLISKEEYRTTIAFVDEFIATVAAIEAIGGTVQTPPVAIYVGGKATAGKESAEADAEAAKTELKVGDIKVDQAGVDKTKADAIRDILQNYYRRKAAYHAFLDGEASRSGQIP